MRFRWTAPAVGDLSDICDYTNEHQGPEASGRIALHIYENISALVTFPRRGRPGRKSGTRELIFPDVPLVAVYRVREDVLEVLRILHGARKWS